jgi:hypothetical protein
MRNVLIVILIGMIIIAVYQKMASPTETFSQITETSTPLTSGPNVPYQPHLELAKDLAPQPLPTTSQGKQETEIFRAYGDFDGPTGPVYFKPNGDMGDKASISIGLLPSGEAGSSGATMNCNRSYCDPCEDEKCSKGTDDIRRNYTALIETIRKHDNAEYPLL